MFVHRHFGKLINDQEFYWCPSSNNTNTHGFTHISTSCASTGAFWTTKYVVKDSDNSPVRYEKLDGQNAST